MLRQLSVRSVVKRNIAASWVVSRVGTLGVLNAVGPAAKCVDRSGPSKNFATVWHGAWDEVFPSAFTGMRCPLMIPNYHYDHNCMPVLRLCVMSPVDEVWSLEKAANLDFLRSE
jgi:hypothetical protein